MADLGRAALLLAFGLALYAAVAGSLAAHCGRRRLHESARNALIGTFAATAVAALVLLNAFRTRDFSFCVSWAALLTLAGTMYRVELAGKRLDSRLRELRELLA